MAFIPDVTRNLDGGPLENKVASGRMIGHTLLAIPSLVLKMK